MVEWILRLENMVAESGRLMEMKFATVDGIQQTQTNASEVIKNAVSEMAPRLENNQNIFSELHQRILAMEARPPNIVFQAPPDATQSVAMATEFNRVMQELQSGIQNWQVKMEKGFEERTQSILVQVGQEKLAQEQKMQGLEKLVVELKQENEALRQAQVVSQVQYQNFGTQIGQAFQGIMGKIDAKMDKNRVPHGISCINPLEGKMSPPMKFQPRAELASPQKVPVRPPLKIDRSRRSAGKPVFSSSFSNADPGNAMEKRVEIRAIGTTPMGTQEGLTIIPPQILSLVLGKGPGPFSGQRAEWAEWKRKFLRFVGEMQETMPTITERQLLSVLRHSLDQGSQAILETALLSNPGLEFSAFWARLELEMGSDDVEEMRSKWHALRLRHQGSLRLAD